MKIRMLKETYHYPTGFVLDLNKPVEQVVILDTDQAIEYGIAEEVREPAYVPYKKVNPEWIGKNVKVISRPADVYLITGLCGNIVYVSGRHDYTLKDMLNNFTWQDGSPFGEQAGGEW